MATTSPPSIGVMSDARHLPLGLTRSATHVYGWNGGKGTEAQWPIPSVTTVLKVLDKSGPLVGWAKRETAACAIRNLDMLVTMRDTGGPESATDWLRKIPDFQRDTAADIGTRVHSLAEQINRGLEPMVQPDETPFIDAYRRDFLTRFRPRFLAVEEMVVNLRHDYSGTLDAIAVLNGEVWLLDIKTGKGIYPESALQLAAYAAADFIGRTGTTRRFRIPRPTRYGVVHVRPEGARLIEYNVDRETFATFLEARRLFAWRETAAKSVIGETVIANEGTEAA